jgi:Na+-driven multidrug efflux pump
MLRLAWPVLVVLALQTSVGVAETYFVSFLGSDAVAGVVLVFPPAVARAIGAGRKRDAEALATHSAMLGILFGAIFTLGAWLCGPALFRWMGGQGGAHVTQSCTRTCVFSPLCRAGSPASLPQHSAELGTF